MGAEGKLPPTQRKRKRPLAEPRAPGSRAPGSDPRAKRGPGKAVATAPTQNKGKVVLPPSLARGTAPNKRVSRQLDGATSSSSVISDVPLGAAGSTR